MRRRTTHFGFQRVPIDEKARKVAEVFHSVAGKYDIMNDLMSMGAHRVWKRFTVGISKVSAGQRVLDLAGGTGDMVALLSRRVLPSGQVVLCDVNTSMLARGRDRLTDLGLVGNVFYVQADAENLPFHEDYFDCITMAFGLRNVTDKDHALASIFRVLRPGGRFLVLEFSRPYQWLTPAYDLYSFKVLPWLGRLIASDADSYRYLAESIRMHPDQEMLKEMMITTGFERCEYFNLSAGIVAVHRGYKF
jgi:demethylmenaquinone methyltransferase/2-methoxy-6-polyprenyl-1,4-benzoquinol methylase